MPLLGSHSIVFVFDKRAQVLIAETAEKLVLLQKAVDNTIIP